MDEGYKTARDVIEADVDDLLVIDGLDEGKIVSLKEMMQRELEEADVEESEEMEEIQGSAEKKPIAEEEPVDEDKVSSNEEKES